MTLSRNGSNRWTAKLAALLFALQAAFAAFSVAAAAAPVMRDQFGHVLCTASGDSGHEGSGSSKGQGHDGGLDCCRLGCSFAGERFVPPAPVSLSAPRRGEGRPLAVPLRDRTEALGPIGEKKARAPPFAV